MAGARGGRRGGIAGRPAGDVDGRAVHGHLFAAAGPYPGGARPQPDLVRHRQQQPLVRRLPARAAGRGPAAGTAVRRPAGTARLRPHAGRRRAASVPGHPGHPLAIPRNIRRTSRPRLPRARLLFARPHARSPALRCADPGLGAGRRIPGARLPRRHAATAGHHRPGRHLPGAAAGGTLDRAPEPAARRGAVAGLVDPHGPAPPLLDERLVALERQRVRHADAARAVGRAAQHALVPVAHRSAGAARAVAVARLPALRSRWP